MLQLHPDFDPDHLSDAPITSDYQYDDGAWDYVDDTYSLPLTDERLEKTYFELAGIHYPDAGDDLVPGNFKEFTRDRIDISFEEHAAQMLFTDDDEGPDSKEVWLTEYNLNDDVKLPSGSYATSNAKQFSNFTGSASNTFAHAAMLQNWFLWNVKVNYNNFYTSNFLTRATLQNSLGGSNTMLSTNSDTTDQVLLNEITDCESITEYPYFVRRATYFAVQLWRPIIDNDLDYLKTTTTMASLNNNLAPSVFVDDNPLDPKIYIYYTNVTNKKQWFGIDPGSIVEIFEDPLLYEAILFPPTVSSKIFVADQLYSTAGKNPLFAINDAYNLCEDAVLAENRFELTTTENYFPMVNCPTAFAAGAPNGLCVEMPPVSMGYIVIPIHFNELRTRELNSEFSIFPNPADNYFFVKQVEESDTPKTSEIKIYNLFGSLIKYVISEESYTYIDISDLSAGVYTIEVTTEGRPAQTETLIKIQ
ncbi:MAG: T9SS type A sorting domain-containing protein [Chitinophagales bacterium]